jgi:hypothetical protein
MIIEHQEPPLMQIVVFSKARSAAPEKHATLTIVVYLYFIRCPITGHLSQNSLMKLQAIHEFSKFPRKALLLIALGASKRKKRKTHFLLMSVSGQVAPNLHPDDRQRWSV